MVSGGEGVWERHTAGDYARQRAFAGVARQLLGHRSVLDFDDAAVILGAVAAQVAEGGIAATSQSTLQRRHAEAMAEKRANAARQRAAASGSSIDYNEDGAVPTMAASTGPCGTSQVGIRASRPRKRPSERCHPTGVAIGIK